MKIENKEVREKDLLIDGRMIGDGNETHANWKTHDARSESHRYTVV